MPAGRGIRHGRRAVRPPASTPGPRPGLHFRPSGCAAVPRALWPPEGTGSPPGWVRPVLALPSRGPRGRRSGGRRSGGRRAGWPQAQAVGGMAGVDTKVQVLTQWGPVCSLPLWGGSGEGPERGTRPSLLPPLLGRVGRRPRKGNPPQSAPSPFGEGSLREIARARKGPRTIWR